MFGTWDGGWNPRNETWGEKYTSACVVKMQHTATGKEEQIYVYGQLGSKDKKKKINDRKHEDE